MFSYGIIGLPNAGKSTLFNALTHAGAEVASYPFCTIEPNAGVLPVPDERLEALGETIKPDKLTPAMMEFVDIAGLVRGASEGEGLGNEFLGHIQQVDAVAHVVRLFDDEDVAHVDGELGPVRDIETVNRELILRDLEIARGRYEDAGKLARSGDKEGESRLRILDAVLKTLEEGNFVNTISLDEEGQKVVREMGLLTRKPAVYVGNVSEEQIQLLLKDGDDIPGECAEFEGYCIERGLPYTWVCAQLESELSELDDPEEAHMFLEEMGITEAGLESLVSLGYSALGLITFYTVKGSETRAWELPEGTLAPRAAGRIHSDMEGGFIKAEVVPWDRLVEAGSFTAARRKGWMRAEGKNYAVKDGDVILFHFKA
jgi:hypothetical protein